MRARAFARLVPALVLLVGLAACDREDPTQPQLAPDAPLAAKSGETVNLLGDDFESGPVIIKLTGVPDADVLDAMREAGARAHPVFGEVVGVPAMPFVIASLDVALVDRISKLPFVVRLESPLDSTLAVLGPSTPVGAASVASGCSTCDLAPQLLKINADSAWELLDARGWDENHSYAYAAVIDGYVDPSLHEGNDPEWLWYREPLWDDYGLAEDPTLSHGMAVTALLGADDNTDPNNGWWYVAGTAPKAHKQSYGAFQTFYDNDPDNDWSEILYALGRVKIERPEVVNLSVGSCNHDDHPSVEDAINDLKSVTTRMGGSGVSVVAAAGNGGCANNAIRFPASMSSTIAVGAVDGNDLVGTNATGGPLSVGSEMDVVAMGCGVVTADVHGNAWQLATDECYTSFAAPQVAGVVAAMRAIHKDLTWYDVRARLRATAEDLGPIGRDDAYGYGLVDMYDAIAYDPVKITSVAGPIQPITEAGYYRWSATVEGGDAPYTYSWLKDGMEVSTLSYADIYVRELDEPEFFLAFTVTDASGQQDYWMERVYVQIDDGGGWTLK